MNRDFAYHLPSYFSRLIKINGAKETRTPDPLHAMQVLYQLSYGPIDNYNNNSIHESLQIWC